MRLFKSRKSIDYCNVAHENDPHVTIVSCNQHHVANFHGQQHQQQQQQQKSQFMHDAVSNKGPVGSASLSSSSSAASPTAMGTANAMIQQQHQQRRSIANIDLQPPSPAIVQSQNVHPEAAMVNVGGNGPPIMTTDGYYVPNVTESDDGYNMTTNTNTMNTSLNEGTDDTADGRINNMTICNNNKSNNNNNDVHMKKKNSNSSNNGNSDKCMAFGNNLLLLNQQQQYLHQQSACNMNNIATTAQIATTKGSRERNSTVSLIGTNGKF